MKYLSWSNHIIGYNNYSETILMAVVMDGPRVSTSGLASDLTLTSCQEYSPRLSKRPEKWAK